MIAAIAQAATADYYVMSQRSMRHPNEYYTGGAEPDGIWWNPAGLFGLENGNTISAKDFYRLYEGYSPETGDKLTQNAGKQNRSAALDLTFSADKSVSALWAIAGPELRADIERAHNDAARDALELTVGRYCATTRHGKNGKEVVGADIMAGMWQHGESRAGDPHLHTHCTIMNIARSHKNGQFRALHQHPFYQWAKAAGTVYGSRFAWHLRTRLGIRMELHGENHQSFRIANMPKDLDTLWSKRHQQMEQSARELGFSLGSSASRTRAVQRNTRAPKTHEDHDIRQTRWDDESAYIDRETLLASVVDELEHHAELTPEQLRDLTATLDALPARLTQTEAVFHYPDLLAAVHLATPGLIDHLALETALARALRHADIIQLPSKPTAEATAGMAHTRVYTSRPTLQLEHAITTAAGRMHADTAHTIPSASVQTKVTALRRGGYPLSDEQIDAIHAATHAQVTLIEGAAGSGKTTTLRPIVDLYREQGYTAIGAATAWITANTLGTDCNIQPFSIAKLLADARKGRLALDGKTLLVIDEAGMLSSREIHNILQLCETAGAKLILAGDTEQQQPIEAGPGLRLARDGAGSVHVHQIRRQLPGLEDVLTHAHRETPETARLKATMTPPAMRERLMAEYEAMADKPAFTPWQVAASEAFRDGNAGEAIAAYHSRGHVHLCRRKEATLERLADDWARYQRDNPGKTSAALVRTQRRAPGAFRAPAPASTRPASPRAIGNGHRRPTPDRPGHHGAQYRPR